jgi:hypothetical protein
MIDEARDRELQDFLLGQLTEARVAAIEQECLHSDRLHAHLLILEDELLADYARGGLGAHERQAVEARLLASNENQARVELLASLWRGLVAEPKPMVTRRFPARWTAAAAAVVVAASGWLALQNRQLQRRVTEADNARAAAQQALDQTRQVSPAVPTPPANRVVALSLTPGLVRATGAPPPLVRVAPGDETLELSLSRPGGSNDPEYRVSIRTPDDEEVWSGLAVGVSGRPLVARVPVADLPRDDYELRLVSASGGPPIAEYYFGMRR